MTWISFVIVVLLFYMPKVGLAPMIHEPNEPLWQVQFPFFDTGAILSFAPLGGMPQLLLYSIVAWAVLTLILLVLEVVSDFTLLEGLRSRNGMLYSTMPWLSNYIVILAARFVAISMSIKLLLEWMSTVVTALIAGGVGPLGLLQSLQTVGASVLALVWFNFDPYTITLTTVTLLADCCHNVVEGFFKDEQRYRYEFEFRRNEQLRKGGSAIIALRQIIDLILHDFGHRVNPLAIAQTAISWISPAKREGVK
jgi:hypothetical protein